MFMVEKIMTSDSYDINQGDITNVQWLQDVGKDVILVFVGHSFQLLHQITTFSAKTLDEWFLSAYDLLQLGRRSCYQHKTNPYSMFVSKLFRLLTPITVEIKQSIRAENDLKLTSCEFTNNVSKFYVKRKRCYSSRISYFLLIPRPFHSKTWAMFLRRLFNTI